ncbi:unnamed protein product [Euphydryas editha]|uniref:Trissin n=1 Tax=Euphydryas editha TaxID=104508 RepID=A0AAU9UNI7_EUPED|nr:unnamed protein product [Euphydryas editha]
MLKITTILVLMCIGTLLAASMSCKSCGPECAPACGTRHFRTCCFNYLRRKRGPDTKQAAFENFLTWRPESKQFTEDFEMLGFTPSEFENYHKDDKTDNTLHNIYM